MKITDVKINGIKNPVGYELKHTRVSWKVRDTHAKHQAGVRIEVADDRRFEHILYIKEGSRLSSLGELLEIEKKPYSRYYVRVQVENECGEKAMSDTAYFETAKMEEPWVGKWITTRGEDDGHPVFFRSFQPAGKVKSARLYISGLGLFHAELNGETVSSEVLTPYYSNYHEEVQYLTFDITDKIKEQNMLYVFLGNGWYKGKFGLAGMKENFGNRFQMIAEIRLVLEDGSVQLIPSDEAWSYKVSDIEASDIYDGEVRNRLLRDGRLIRGKRFMAGEFSYLLTESSDPMNSRWVFAETGGVPALIRMVADKKQIPEKELDGEKVFSMANCGDEEVLDCIRKYSNRIAMQITNCQFMFDPDRIAVGGGISVQPLFIQMIREELKKLNSVYPHDMPVPEVVPCKFFNDSNLIGALYVHLKSKEESIDIHKVEELMGMVKDRREGQYLREMLMGR